MKEGKKVIEALRGDFVAAKSRVKMTPGESIKVVRELQEMSQAQLAERCGIPQSTISGLESGRINLGVERAKVLARALRVHPAVLLFPGWDVARESAA